MLQHNIPKVQTAQHSCNIKRNPNQDGVQFV